jgi:DNA-binding NtrC family response regulator
MLPHLLILDDLFGRVVPGGHNVDRENLCANFLWQDQTGDAEARASRQKVLQPTATAVFFRAQTPVRARVGDTVENDIQATLEVVRNGWISRMDSNVSAAQAQAQAQPWTILLLDLCFYTGLVTVESHRRTPGMPEGRPGDDRPESYFGLTLLDAIHQVFPELPIFILSSKPRQEVSLEFSRRGALGFIARDDLRGPELLEEALWNHGLLPDETGEFVGTSLPLLLALREARRTAGHRENVLIRGERGTGKELMAHYLHHVASRDRERSFVPVNSAVFTTDLFASELFGIQPRTATGVDGKIGLIEAANGGDLFLDEIADMSTEVQAAVLRVLQERKVTPVGARLSTPVDVRFLSATNVDLDDPTLGFRADLLDRLRTGGTISLPRLCDRPSDIPLLVENFVRAAEAQRPGTRYREVTKEAIDQLVAYEWPGNIRELRSAIFDAVNRHADVEFLVPGHLRIGSDRSAGMVGRSPEQADEGYLRTRDPETNENAIVELLNLQNSVTFDSREAAHWAGRLGDLQIAQAKLLGRYLGAGLAATKRRTPGNPTGQIQIHPAVKLITGDSAITASKAADLIKRLLGPIAAEIDGDLREAYNIAVRLRPKTSKATEKGG